MSLVIAQDFIVQALRHIGAVRPGYTPGPEILADGLTEWGLLFDEWNTDRLLQYSNPDYTYTISGVGSQNGGLGYTIGPTGANITGPRPTSIVRMNVVLNPLSSTPIYIPLAPLSQEQWASKSVRKIPAINVASEFWYDPQFPNGVLNIWPPIISGTVIELFQFGALTVPATLATAYSGPPGYSDAIVKSLAMRMYYLVTMEIVKTKKPYPVVAGQALAAIEKLKTLNRPLNMQPNDFAGHGADVGFFDQNVRWTGEPY
jgi:hypothetical protein